MKLTITKEDNERSLKLLAEGRSIGNSCPTALAFRRQTGIEVSVGYDYATDYSSGPTRYYFDADLKAKVLSFTLDRPKPEIIGTFEITKL